MIYQRLCAGIYGVQTFRRESTHQCIVLVAVYGDNIAVTRSEIEAVAASVHCFEIFKVSGLLHHIISVSVGVGHHHPFVGIVELVYVRSFYADIAF